VSADAGPSLWKRWLRPFALGWIAGIACMALSVLAVIEAGAFDTASISPHPPPIAWATHLTMIRSTSLRSRGVTPPGRFTADQLYAGFRAYDTECAMCHGGPGVDRQPWTRGMTPTPPYLLEAARIWRPRELYWIVGKGVRMTGMPAWLAVRPPAEVWDVVGFLEVLPCVSPAGYQRLRRTGGRPPAPIPVACRNPHRAPEP
jgi:hypothetical protein